MPDNAKKNVVLINPRATYAHEIAQKVYPPSSLLYLAASLEQAGMAPQVIEANAFGLSDGETAARLLRFAPDLVGIPVYSEILPQVLSLTRLVKAAASQSRIVLGGPHATSAPELCLEQFPEADFVLAGEAEDSLPELVRRMDKPRGYSKVPGLYWRDKGQVKTRRKMEFPDVNTAPLPAKHLVRRAYEKEKYYSLLVRRRPVDTLFTSRGCPFSCGFCYNFRHSYRARKPEDVVEELARIAARGIRDVEICDDTFTVNEGRALDIFALIQKEKLDVSFRIKSRVDAFTPRLATAAKKAGVYLVAFGMESASPRVLAAMNKKITIRQMARAGELCKTHGLACHTSWVLGYPGETPETVEQTVQFILKTRPTTANLAVLRPYPHTPVYDQARQEGSLVGDWDPNSPEFPWVRLPWAPRKRVLDDLCKKAIRRIYFTPHYAANFGARIVGGANWQLLRYALQEAKKVALGQKALGL